MFKHRNDLDDVREYRPLGLSGEGLENRDKHLCGNAQVFTHHSEPDPDAVPRRPQVLFEGEDIYARNSGSVMSESLKTMGASQLGLTKEEPRTPVEQKPLAKSCLQELFEYKPEYDPKNAAANDNADNGKLNQHKDSAMNDTLHNYGKNEPEPAPNPKVRPEAEEYVYLMISNLMICYTFLIIFTQICLYSAETTSTIRMHFIADTWNRHVGH